MQTRFPFRYGIASLTDLPHLLVAVDVVIDSQPCRGVSADGLPPKWFTKNEGTTFADDDLPAMLKVIRNAADLAEEIGPQRSVFSWWWELYQAQTAWAKDKQVPPLLAGLGTSLIERAVIDAVCRHTQTTLFDALKTNAFEIELSTIRPELGQLTPADCLPSRPRASVAVRHTVGLGDPITPDDIAPQDRMDDGLPHSLVDSIRAYGLKFFKIKLSGDVSADFERLASLASTLEAEVGATMRFTLDGNEQYREIHSFRDAWAKFRSDSKIRAMMDGCLLFVEQPLHRDSALDRSVGETIAAWDDAPPIIIDESDASLESLPLALDLGYSGTSHKNCKGILKGLAAAATIAHRSSPSHPLILSAEDLGNVGPVALLQDLAMVSALGIEHVERNGHHYFAGLSRFPSPVQERVLADSPDLYQRNDRGYASLAIAHGQLNLGSVNRAPFGVVRSPELFHFRSWDF